MFYRLGLGSVVKNNFKVFGHTKVPKVSVLNSSSCCLSSLLPGRPTGRNVGVQLNAHDPQMKSV